MPDLTVHLATAADQPAVEAFWQTHADTTVFHLPAWHAVIAATYGHRCDYWLARRGDAIAGVFPVTTMRLPGPAARLRPPKLLAMPYQLYSGLPVAADEAVQTALVRHALVAAKQQRASYLEIRHHAPAPFLEALGFVPVESGLVTTAVPLPNISLKSIRRNHRRNCCRSRRPHRSRCCIRRRSRCGWRSTRRCRPRRP